MWWRHAGGPLRIYCHPGFGRDQLAPLLPRFAAKQADIVLDVTMDDKNVDLVEDGFDVGIYIGIQKIEPSMVARRLATSNVILCAAPAAPRELRGHDCLNYAYEELRHQWPMRCGAKELVPRAGGRPVAAGRLSGAGWSLPRRRRYHR
ncbi:LysR substrate-binding domain-containing protein [Rugamonas rubra]|uniref:LysR substrate-binding domain-containing protein n=1 Tax=Rugamonas rubra TaxID=758825 RepID=UPI001FE5F116|nr:LysR substrate-binding domain-containing protein [Rugamonas rubra]